MHHLGEGETKPRGTWPASVGGQWTKRIRWGSAVSENVLSERERRREQRRRLERFWMQGSIAPSTCDCMNPNRNKRIFYWVRAILYPNGMFLETCFIVILTSG